MMKPFNLEAAKAGKPLVTRDGRSVKYVLCVDEATCLDKLIVLLDRGGGLNAILRYPTNGRYADSKYDLFMAPTKKTYWANVYRSNGFTFITNLYSEAIDAANEAGKMDKSCVLLKTISVEVEE